MTSAADKMVAAFRHREAAIGSVQSVVVPPIRTCVGCRARCGDVDLLRVTIADGNLVPDPRRRLPGRGAWIHPEDGCIVLAQRRRAFSRAFAVSTELDVTPISRYISQRWAGGRSPSPTATFRELGNEVDPS